MPDTDEPDFWDTEQPAASPGAFVPTADHDAQVTEALLRRAVGGETWSEKLDRFGEIHRLRADLPPDIAAAKLWLQARAPEQWAEKRTMEHRVIVARLGMGSEREAVGLTYEGEAGEVAVVERIASEPTGQDD